MPSYQCIAPRLQIYLPLPWIVIMNYTCKHSCQLVQCQSVNRGSWESTIRYSRNSSSSICPPHLHLCSRVTGSTECRRLSGRHSPGHFSGIQANDLLGTSSSAPPAPQHTAASPSGLQSQPLQPGLSLILGAWPSEFLVPPLGNLNQS